MSVIRVPESKRVSCQLWKLGERAHVFIDFRLRSQEPPKHFDSRMLIFGQRKCIPDWECCYHDLPWKNGEIYWPSVFLIFENVHHTRISGMCRPSIFGATHFLSGLVTQFRKRNFCWMVWHFFLGSNRNAVSPSEIWLFYLMKFEGKNKSDKKL